MFNYSGILNTTQELLFYVTDSSIVMTPTEAVERVEEEFGWNANLVPQLANYSNTNSLLIFLRPPSHRSVLMKTMPYFPHTIHFFSRAMSSLLIAIASSKSPSFSSPSSDSSDSSEPSLAVSISNRFVGSLRELTIPGLGCLLVS